MSDPLFFVFIFVLDVKIYLLLQERKEKEALVGEGGWTVVVHHKGRKKTTDSETGIAVGSVAQAAVENKMTKKKRKEVGLDFYRFQKREAQRNGIIFFFTTYLVSNLKSMHENTSKSWMVHEWMSCCCGLDSLKELYDFMLRSHALYHTLYHS